MIVAVLGPTSCPAAFALGRAFLGLGYHVDVFDGQYVACQMPDLNEIGA